MRGWGLGDWQLRDCLLHFVPPTSIVMLRDCRSRSARTSSSVGALPKAFQTNTTCSFGFFIAHPLNQASLFRVFALKKPLICMRGFVATIGASLEEFAGDIRSILDAKLKNL